MMKRDWTKADESFRWFAWRPTKTLDRGWRWLRMVNKRKVLHYSWVQDDMGYDGGYSSWFQTKVSDFE